MSSVPVPEIELKIPRGDPTPVKLAAYEGLRGVAAMIVLINHLVLAFFPFFPAKLHAATADLPWLVSRTLCGSVEWLYDGHFAVWVFWVMSATVLSLRYFELRSRGNRVGSRGYLLGAAIRRYPRLVIPIFAAVALGYFVLRADLVWAAQASAISESIWLTDLYAFPADIGIAVYEAFVGVFYEHQMSHTYNAALWTMYAEFVGSLFVFAVMAIIGGVRWRVVGYVCLAIALLFFKLDYLNGFLCGLMMADALVYLRGKDYHLRNRFFRRLDTIRANHVLTIAIMAIVLILVGQPNDRQMMTIVLAVAVCVLVLILTPLNKLLSTRLPVFLGRISFGVYLVHLPIIASFSCWMYVSLAGNLPVVAAAWITSCATVVLSLFAGYWFHRLVDAPAVRISKRIQDRVLEAAYLLARPKPTPISSSESV